VLLRLGPGIDDESSGQRVQYEMYGQHEQDCFVLWRKFAFELVFCFFALVKMKRSLRISFDA